MNEESFEFTQYIILQEKFFVTVFEITVVHSNLTYQKNMKFLQFTVIDQH